MNIQQLEYFTSIAETLNYSKSAELLGVSQPALSMSITKLEEELGFALFAKCGRNIMLTESGKSYYQTAQNAMQILKDGAFDAKSILDAHADFLNIAINNDMVKPFVGALLGSFMTQFPDIKMSIYQKDSIEIVNMLKTRTVDWVITPLHKYLLESNDIQYEVITSQQIYAIMDMNHPLANKERVELTDLLNQTCLVNTEFWEGRIKQTLNGMGQDGTVIDFRIIPVINVLIEKLLQQKNTVYITNSPTQRMIIQPNLKIVPLSDMDTIKETYILGWYGRRKEVGVHNLFYNFIKNYKF